MESVFGTNTWSGGVTLNAVTTIGVDAGSLAMSAAIGGPGDLTKVNGGTLSLNAANTFTGQVNINNGIVNFNNSTSFGVDTAPIIVNGGATLQISTTALTVLRALQLNGTGFAASNVAGALQMPAVAAATWAGNITLNPGATIGVGTAGNTITVNGIISGNTDLVKVGPGVLALQAANTYTGNTVIDAGTVDLLAAGTALTTTGVIVNAGGNLTLDNNANAGTTSINLANRLTSTTGVTLNAASFNFIANPGVGVAPLATTQTLGTVTLGPGQSTIEAGARGCRFPAPPPCSPSPAWSIPRGARSTSLPTRPPARSPGHQLQPHRLLDRADNRRQQQLLDAPTPLRWAALSLSAPWAAAVSISPATTPPTTASPTSPPTRRRSGQRGRATPSSWVRPRR